MLVAWGFSLLYGLLVLLTSCEQCRAGLGGATNDLDKVIEDLARTIADSQVQKSTKFDPPFSFAKQFGIYPSNIRVNYRGGPDETLLRHLLAIYDSNAFVTLWVTSMLLEAAQQPGGPQPTSTQLYHALEALSTYHDRNYPSENSILIFWPEKYNESTGFWSCGPANLQYLVDDMLTVLNALQKMLDDLGLKKLWEEVLATYEQIKSEVRAFQIPADFDDTFVNIGLGSLLLSSPTHSSSFYTAWQKNNTNFVAAMTALKKYAYKPLSRELDSGLIDPRTYFFLREYLYSEVINASVAAYTTTWAQSVSEDRKDFYKLYSMPFNINNVDLTVSTNVIYGITSAVLANMSDPGSWFDSELQIIYENTTSLISWMIERNFSSRPDLGLAYYPSVFNFYWYTARTLNLLASAPSLPYPVLERAHYKLTSALRGAATPTLLEQATVEGDTAFWDDFLGDNDTDILGKPVKHGEDRICSTAMALNTLLYTWTVRGELVADTPTAVRDVASKAGQWLIRNVLSGDFEAYCVTFSGSVKSITDFPFFFPYNYAYYLNGTAIPPDGDITAESLFGVQAIISQEEYDKMLKQEHFGQNVTMDFHGYNAGPANLIFWSSAPFTYAASLLALTQYRNLLASGQLELPAMP